MIPKEIELQILEELEGLDNVTTVSIFRNAESEYCWLNSKVAEQYAIDSGLKYKTIEEKKCFLIAELKTLFENASYITLVEFYDYSKAD